MPRFAFVIKDFFGGGAQRSLLDIAAGLNDRGNKVIVYTLKQQDHIGLPSSLNVINLRLENKLTRLLRSPFVERWQAAKIESQLGAFNPDIVFAVSCHSIARYISGYNLVMWVKIDKHLSGMGAETRRKWELRNRRIYRGRQCVVPSQGVKNSLITHVGVNPNLITVIPNAFDERKIHRLASEYDGKVSQVIPEPFFLSAGTLAKRKRHDWLLQAYKRSAIKTPLIIAGTGSQSDHSRVQRQIEALGLKGRVYLIGYVKNPYPLISAAKAVLLTSEREGLPRILIESLILGTPVLAFDCPSGPREILAQEMKEWLVPLGDIETLSEKIEKIDKLAPVVNADIYRRFLYANVLEKFERFTREKVPIE